MGSVLVTLRLHIVKTDSQKKRSGISRPADETGNGQRIDHLSPTPAVPAGQRCRQLEDEGLYWFEEPIRHDDYAGSAELAGQPRTPVPIGENLAGPRAISAALAADASDLLIADLVSRGSVRGRDSS